MGTSDARWGCENRGAVQLRELRSAGADGSSVAGDPQDRQRGADGAVTGIREALCQVRPAIDSAGETASRAAVALIQAVYSVRSERQLMEQLDYNLLLRCLSGCRWMPWCGNPPTFV